jgi:hypothetical protein
VRIPPPAQEPNPTGTRGTDIEYNVPTEPPESLAFHGIGTVKTHLSSLFFVKIAGYSIVIMTGPRIFAAAQKAPVFW